jgi:hypothetical protein
VHGDVDPSPHQRLTHGGGEHPDADLGDRRAGPVTQRGDLDDLDLLPGMAEGIRDRVGLG